MSHDLAPRGDRMVHFIESDQCGEPVANYRLMVVDHAGERTPCGAYEGAAADVLDDVESRALQQSNVLGGTNNFELQALNADGEVIATEVFRVNAEAMGLGSAISEPANEGGFMAHMMRHDEIKTRLIQDQTSKMFTQQSRLMEQLAKRAEWSERKHLEGLQIVQAAILSEREHEIDLVKTTAKAESMKVLATKVSNMLPDVAAAVIGKARDKSMAAALVARDLFESLDDKQFQIILGTLDTEQGAKVLKLMKDLATEAEKESDSDATH